MPTSDPQRRPRVVVTAKLPGGAIRPLRDACDVDLYDGPEPMPTDLLAERLATADGLVCFLTNRVDASMIDAAPSLKVIADVSVGYDNVDVPAARRRNIVVTNTPGVLTDATADLTWALILSTMRRVVEADRFVRAGKWKGFAFDLLLGGDLKGKQLGIIGLGRIGQAVARRAVGFGMTIAYVPSPRAGAQPQEQFDGFTATPLALDPLLRSSDVVSLHAPSTAETKHVINQKTLMRMKRSAYLINVARGPVVDEQALAWALREHIIAGAGLDVFEREPEIEPDLLTLENVVLLPHLGSATVGTRTAMAQLAVENCIAVLSGRPPVTPVP